MVSYDNFDLFIQRTPLTSQVALSDFISFRFSQEKDRIGQLKLTALSLSSGQKTALGEPSSKIGSLLIVKDKAGNEIERYRIRQTNVQEYSEFYDIIAMQIAVDLYDQEITFRKEYPVSGATKVASVLYDVLGTAFSFRVSVSLKNRLMVGFRVEPGPIISILATLADAYEADWYVDWDPVASKPRFNLVAASDQQGDSLTLYEYSSKANAEADSGATSSSADRFINRKSNSNASKNYKPVLQSDIFNVRRIEDDEHVFNDVQLFGIVAGFNSPRCRIYDSTAKVGRIRDKIITSGTAGADEVLVPPETNTAIVLNNLSAAITTSDTFAGDPILVVGNEAMKIISVGALVSGTQTVTVFRWKLENLPTAISDAGYFPSVLVLTGSDEYNHSTNTLVYQLIDETSTGGVLTPETGTSIQVYGRRQVTINKPEVIDQDAIDQVCKQAYLRYHLPLTRIEIFVSDQLPTATPGDLMDLLAADGVTSDSGGAGYTIEKAEYSGDDDGVYYTLNRYRLYFFDGVSELTKDVDIGNAYGQGSNTLTSNDVYDNIKGSATTPVPLKVRPYIPNEVKAINTMLLQFSTESFRNFSAGSSTADTTDAQDFTASPELVENLPINLNVATTGQYSGDTTLTSSLTADDRPVTISVEFEPTVASSFVPVVTVLSGTTIIVKKYGLPVVPYAAATGVQKKATVVLGLPSGNNLTVKAGFFNLDRTTSYGMTARLISYAWSQNHTHGMEHTHDPDIVQVSIGSGMKLKLKIVGTLATVDKWIKNDGTLVDSEPADTWSSGTSVSSRVDLLPHVIAAYGANFKGKFLNMQIYSPNDGALARLEANVVTQLFVGTSKKVNS